MTKQQLLETIRRVIKQELNEALTPEEQKELEELEYEFTSDVRHDSAISPSLYKRYKELKAKEAKTDEAAAPAPSKPKEKPGPAVAPGKPGEKQKPRRPLGNPSVKPAPKATMSEAEMLAKIVKRFKSAKKINENAEQKYNYVKTNKYVDGKAVNVVGFYPDPKGTFTKEKANNLSNVSKFDKWEIKFYKNKQEAELAIKSKK